MALAAPAQRAALHDVSLDDKYALETGRVFLTGAQAFVRLLILQRQRDVLAGLNTAGFVSGYRGSPLGALDQSLWKAQPFLDRAHIKFQPGLNEDLAATSIWGSQQVNLYPGATLRRRVRDVVRQGAGGGPLRRRVQAREPRRHVEARRRAGAGGGRSRRQVVDAAAPVRPHVLGGDDAGALPVERAGDPRPRPARLGDVALLRRLGRLQVRRRHRRELGVGLHRSGANGDRHPGRLPAAARRRLDPLAGRVPRDRSADAELQDLRGAALLPRQPAEPDRHRFAAAAPRHHHQRQELSRRPPGARRSRHHRRRCRGNRHPRLQGGDAVAARAGRRAPLRGRAGRDPRRRGKAAGRRIPAEGAALQLARRRAAARRRQVRRKGRVGAARTATGCCPRRPSSRRR